MILEVLSVRRWPHRWRWALDNAGAIAEPMISTIILNGAS